MSQFGPNSNKPINIFNETPGFADEATEAFLSQDIDFSDPMQVQRAGQALNDLNIDVPRNLQGQITSQQALQDRIYTLQAKRAQQMVDLNVMVNKSRVDFNERVQGRYGQVEDDKGNPNFGTLQEDIGKIGKEIMDYNAQSLQDPITKERYLALFGNEVKNQQIDAKGQARTQQLNYMRSSYDVQHNGLLALAKSNGLMDGGLLIKDFSQQLAVGVDQGVLSEQEAVEKEQNFRKALSKDKVTAIKEEFDLNTKQVLDATTGTSPESMLQGMNPLGKYKAQFLEAGKRLNSEAGVATTKISDIKPGGIPTKQLAADGKTKLPRVKQTYKSPKVERGNSSALPPGTTPAGTKDAGGFDILTTTTRADSFDAFARRMGTGAERSIRSPEQVKAEEIQVTRGPIQSSARVAKANEKTAIENAGTVEGLDNSIQQAETKIDELEKQGVMLPNEAGKLKKEIGNKFSTMLKTAASSRAKEAGRRVKTNAALEKTAIKNINAVMSSLEEGKPISPDQLASLEDSIASTPFEAKYQQRINKAKAMSVHSNLSQAARQRVVDGLEGPLKEDFKKLNAKLEESYIKDPVKALVDQGFMEVQPLDFNADNLGEQLEVRSVIAEVTESQTGRVNSGLTNQEIKDFTKAFEEADDVTKTDMLGQIATALSPRAAREVYASFDKKGSGYLATAGSFYSQGGDGIKAADTVLAGQRALKEGTFKGMKQYNAEVTPQAVLELASDDPLFPDQRSFKGMQKQIMDRVKLAYAGLSAEKGDLANEEIDSDRLEDAVNLALGGGSIEIGGKGSPVLRPDFNTGAEEVNDLLGKISKGDIGKLGGIKGLNHLLGRKESDEVIGLGSTLGIDSDIPNSDLTKLFLEDAEYTSVGQGKYSLSVNGSTLLNHSGEEFILDINVLKGNEGIPKKKSKTMQEALQSKQMLSQIQAEQEQELNDPESGIITDIMAHNNIIQTTEGLKDVSNMAVDDIDAAFQVGESLGVVPEDVIAFYDGQTNETGDIGLPTEEFARLAVEHGSKYGITEDMSYNPKAQVAMAAELYKELQTSLEKADIPATVRDVRAAQVLGKGTAIKLIKAMDANPNTPIDEVFSSAEIAKFPELYSGDVMDVFYKVTDLSFEDDAYIEAKASENVFVEGQDDFNEVGLGVFD